MSTPTDIAERALAQMEAATNELQAQRSRIAELEAALRRWRNHYECSPSPDGSYIMVPAHQLDALLIGAVQK